MNKNLILFVALVGTLLAPMVEATDFPAKSRMPSFAPMVEKMLPVVVNISTKHQAQMPKEKLRVDSSNPALRDYFLQDEGSTTSLGSGFLVDPKGYIVTNYHVIKDAQEIVVKLASGSSYTASVIGSDEPTDIGMIKIETAENLPFADLGDSDTLKVGDWILAIGNPFGLGSSVSAGIVSAKSRDIDMGSYDNFIQTDAAINQGSSGGPMFNTEGKIVGISTALFSSSGESIGVGFATPINLGRFVIAQLMEKGIVERGWIGVKITANEKPLAISDKDNFTGGVVISEVVAGSPADKSGIQVDDIVIAVNGRNVEGVKSFSREIAETPKDKNIILRVWRAGMPKDFTMVVEKAPLLQESVAVENETAELSEYASLPSSSSLLPEAPKGYITELGIAVEEKDGHIEVIEVLEDSLSAVQGIKTGDILGKINSNEIKSVSDARSYVDYALSGNGQLQLSIVRDGEPHNVYLEIKK